MTESRRWALSPGEGKARNEGMCRCRNKRRVSAALGRIHVHARRRRENKRGWSQEWGSAEVLSRAMADGIPYNVTGPDADVPAQQRASQVDACARLSLILHRTGLDPTYSVLRTQGQDTEYVGTCHGHGAQGRRTNERGCLWT